MSESGRGWVLEIWQEKNEHVLSTPRREEFLGHDLVGRLSKLTRGAVRKGASEAMRLNQGYLLLWEWLDEALRSRAETRAENRKTGRKPKTDRTHKTDPEPEIDRTPRSRPQESRPGTHRWQETWDAWNKPGAQH